MFVPAEMSDYPLERDDALASEGAVPVVLSSLTFELSDAFISALIFFLAAQQQNEIAASPHFLALIFLLLAFLVLFNVIKRRLGELSAQKDYNKHALARYLGRLLVYSLAYMFGLFTRTLADRFLGGPKVGVFSMWLLLIPITAVMLFLHLLFLLNMRGSPRIDVTRLTAT